MECDFVGRNRQLLLDLMHSTTSAEFFDDQRPNKSKTGKKRGFWAKLFGIKKNKDIVIEKDRYTQVRKELDRLISDSKI